ncbi:SHOCT domain-containing protein [Ottowia sp.]|uniref:SHOCT domain-containing protein n=1 Tax=Ottowia sp. TaxID=1898956 RepID=UPI003930A6B3
MQLIFILLVLFAIGCVLYGISAGVQVFVRGFAHLTRSARDHSTDERPLASPLAPATAKTADEPTLRRGAPQSETGASKTTEASPVQRSIDELREIFSLYQQGALTQTEFENIKQALLTTIN